MTIEIVVVVGLYFLLLFASVCEGAISLTVYGAELISVENVEDGFIATAFIFVAYLLQYFLVGYLLESSNPNGVNSKMLNEKRMKKRKAQVHSEIRYGSVALLVTVIITAFWMFYLEKYIWTYGYFQTHDYNIFWFFGGLISYVFWFDTWFYWSHKWLHENDFLWNHIHFIHHQFKEPSAFAQFAVHPFEAALQGPIGHFCATLFFPFHPIPLALLGFLGSIWALGAHDGREYDFNHHYYHHSKGRGRFIYFNLGYITPFWDILCGTRWSESHPQWQKWQKEGGKTIFDTRSGSINEESNDIYGAYTNSNDHHHHHHHHHHHQS